MTKRKTIPETVKLKLWVKSAGRCEFKGCNKLLWQNGLTLSEGNFAEIAHIIASSPKGARGNTKSTELQTNFDNLMLLCPDCHKEIDRLPNKYPTELLQKWKKEHEERIEIQTSIPQEIHQSTILQFRINIGDRIVPINDAAMFNAIFPRYPTNKKGIKIEKTDFNRFEEPQYWQAFANDIKRKIKYYFEEGYDDKQIKHLSIFAIAPMPLLMYLGVCIGDTVPTDIYQSHRNIVDTNQTWSWQEEDTPTETYIINEKKIIKNSKNVALLLSLSDKITIDKYSNFVKDDFSIYEITINEPNPLFIKTKRQVESFSYEYRKLLNKIQELHGRNCNIFILPAIPISIAIETGRAILPTKDPKIFICEYYKDKGYKQQLKIN